MYRLHVNQVRYKVVRYAYAYCEDIIVFNTQNLVLKSFSQGEHISHRNFHRLVMYMLNIREYRYTRAMNHSGSHGSQDVNTPLEKRYGHWSRNDITFFF